MTYKENPPLWYWGDGEEPEICYGGYQTKEEAVDHALANMAYPSDGFTVMRADKKLVQFSNLVEADWILERIVDNNEDCFGEDGPDYDVDQEAIDDLVKSVDATVEKWAKRNKVDFKEWTFLNVTSIEVIYPPECEAE